MAGEVLLSSVADGIIGQLAKAIQNEVALVSGVEDELQKLKDTISTIKSVLVDAEKRQVQEEQIKTWLRRLEDAVYEADDFVDEFSTDQALRSQQQAVTGNTLAKKGTSIKPFQQTLMMKNIVGPPTSSDKASSSSSASSAALLPLSTLKILEIRGIHELQYFPVGFETLTSLEKLKIENCSELKSLHPVLHHLISLQQLEIRDCKELEMPYEDSDAILWQHLQSLSILRLYKLPKLVALPEALQQVASLQEISISECEILEAVLECVKSLKSLRRLAINDCPSLMCLPDGIDGLTSLKELEIVKCPVLLEKCRKDTGDYWPMISHIEKLILKEDYSGPQI